MTDSTRGTYPDQLFDLPVRLPSEAERDWVLVNDGFDPERERSIESALALSNGSLGTRASVGGGEGHSMPGTYISGVFVRGVTDTPSPAAIAPDLLRVEISLEGRPLDLLRGEILRHRRILDLRRGIFWRDWRQRDPEGRVTRVVEFRLASMAHRSLLVGSVVVVPENYSGRIAILPAPHRPGPSPFATPDNRLAARLRPGRGRPASWAATRGTLHAADGDRLAAFAAADELVPPSGSNLDAKLVRAQEGRIACRAEVEIGRPLRLERIVAVRASREVPDPLAAASSDLQVARVHGLPSLLEAHERAWAERWRTADVVVEGDPKAQRAIRFACYHLISASNPDDERTSIGARALTGSAYSGHVFWDAEIYLLPFFSLTHPASARSLLMYRYHTLNAARARARSFGYRGALYAWESADSGEDVTPSSVRLPNGEVIPVRTGEQEIHVSAAVAYATWAYWKLSADDDFFRRFGAEIIMETARFWAGRGQWEEDGRLHIPRVIGPDEYHEDVDDSVYTNLLAAWNLERGVETAALLRQRWPSSWIDLCSRAGFDADEVSRWRELARAIDSGFREERGLHEAFRGYFELEDIALERRSPRETQLEVTLGRKRLQQSQLVKQADVVLLLHLLWDHFPPEVRRADFRYYEPRCAHGSSLSAAIHSLVAGRLGELELAQRYFHEAAAIDLEDTLGNSEGGVHIAALGGLWQAIVFGFAGVRAGDDQVVLDVHLPPSWARLRFSMRWRGSLLSLDLDGSRDALEVTHEDGATEAVLKLEGGEVVTLEPGSRYGSRRIADVWGGWQRLPP